MCQHLKLWNVYLQHGPVKEVRMVTYRSGAPKGLAYVEFEDEVCFSLIVHFRFEIYIACKNINLYQVIFEGFYCFYNNSLFMKWIIPIFNVRIRIKFWLESAEDHIYI